MLLCELVAKYARDAGVDTAFGLVGEGNIGVMTSLQEQGAHYVPVRREDGAVSMADGFARRSGRVGFASVTHGGGLTNALTALTEATRRGSPVVVVTALTERAALHNSQRIAAEDFVTATGSGWREVRGAGHVAADVRAAFRDAWAERRASVLAVPTELLYAEVDALLLDGSLPEVLPDPYGPVTAASLASPDDVQRIRALIEKARRPLVLAGEGVARSGGRAPLEQLAEKIDAALATTLLAKGLFSGNPRHIGICGGFASGPGAERIQSADLVLAFGCSLNPWTTMQGQLFETATVVHCDRDPGAIGRWLMPDVGVTADAGALASDLIDAVEVAETDTGDSARQLRANLSSSDVQAGPPFVTGDLLAGFREWIPKESIVAADVGHAVLDFITHLDVLEPARFMVTLHAGSIGLALGAAIGASVAADSEWTFLFIGDGALLMSLQELDTLRRLSSRLVVVLLDDGGYGAELQYCAAHGLPETLAHLDNPDFGQLAKTFDISYHEIVNLDDLKVIEEILDGPAGPAMLHVPVDPRTTSRWYEQFTASVEPVKAWTGGA